MKRNDAIRAAGFGTVEILSDRRRKKADIGGGKCS
jgi:hypothetical protein